MTADYPDWTVPQAHANAIAGTGVPLLSKPGLLFIDTGRVITAGNQFTYPTNVIVQPGYTIAISVTFPAGTAIPFCRVRLVWTDSTTALQMQTDTFIVPGSTSVLGFTVYGQGNCKADNLNVAVFNLDGANSATVSVSAIQDSIVRITDEWTWANSINSGMTVPGFTLPTLPWDETILGIVANVNVAFGTNKEWLFGMATGAQVMITGDFSGIAVGSQRLHVYAAPDSEYGTSIDLIDFQATSNNNQLFYNPTRGPVRVSVGNTAGAGTLTGTLIATRLT